MKTTNRSAIRLALATVSTVLVLCPFVARADVVLDWNVIMQTTVGGSPHSLSFASPPSPNWRCSKQ